MQTAIGSITSAIAGNDPVQNAFQEFERYFDQHVKIEIVTGLKTYTDMYLTSFNVTRNADTGRVLAFTMGAQQLLTAETAVVDALVLPKKIKQAKNNATKARRNSGRVNAEQVSNQVQTNVKTAFGRFGV